jgi:hypothetical protein
MDVVTNDMKRPPIAHPVAIVLVSSILLTQGCRQDQETPRPPPPQTTTTTSQPAASQAPSPDLTDERAADRRAVNRCCAILQNKANTAETEQRGTYTLALAACNAAKGHRKGKAHAVAQVRKALGEITPPAACR